MSTQGKVAVGHPVDVATGTMFNTWVDVVIGGIIPLTFTRYYSSALASRGASGPLGPGWRHGYQHELRQTVEGFAYVDPSGAQTAIEDLDGAFASSGRLVVVRDQLELRGTLDAIELRQYGPAGQPHSLWFTRRQGTARYVLRALGRRNRSLRLEFEYDAQQRLARVVQRRSGRALRLEHDASDRLAAVWFESEGARDLSVGFAYDHAGRLARVRERSGPESRYEYDQAGLMLSEVSSRGSLHTFRYDASSRCVYASGADRYEERQLTYFPREHRTEVADSHGAVTTYRYNDAGQVVEAVDPLGAREQFGFDDDGRMVAITDASGKTARMEYDRWGHLCAATYPDGKKVVTTYDERHLPLTMVDYWGNVWRYEYDADGQLLGSVNPSGLEWRYAYNEHGEVTVVRNPAGATASMEWDRAGHPHVLRDADGGEWRKEFDHYGRCTMVRDPNGGVTRYEFDSLGNLARTTQPDGRVYESRRDASRRTQTGASPEGQHLVVYNACGKPIERWLPDGSVVRFTWDTEPGRLLSVTDGMGRSTRYEHDAAGRVIERSSWDGKQTRFEHDPLGNLTAVIDAAGGRTEFAYDDWGNLVKRTAADGAVTAYTYDANALPIRIETADARIEFERDYYGRILAERLNGVLVSSEYDAAGHRVGLRSNLGADVRYDWTPGGACAAVAFRGKTIRFEYDAMGQELACELPEAWRVEQAYDPCGRLLEQTCSRAAAPTRERSGQTWAPIVRRAYRYDQAGHVEAISDSLRGAARFVHDYLGRLHAVVHLGERIECFGYDRADNRAFAVRAAGAAIEPLIQELVRKGSIEPRELTSEEELEHVERGAGNETIRVTRGAKTIRYTYDTLGRLTHKHVEAPGRSAHWSFEWNALGQLVGVLRPDGARWSYRYDGLGRRIAKIAPDGARRTYVWDGTSLLHDVSAHGATTIVEHPHADAPLIEENRGQIAYAVIDRLGSVSERLDERGAIVWRSRHGPWGEPGGEEEEGASGFPGQRYDRESGLYYNHHRYYDPELGKYISPDPIGLLGGLNEYAYVPSPVEWTDVLGLAGGPHVWKSKGGSQAYPDLRFHNDKATNRTVINGSSNRANKVDPPGYFKVDKEGNKVLDHLGNPIFMPDSGGKTLTVFTGPKFDHEQEYTAFVSGLRGGKVTSAQVASVFPNHTAYYGGRGNATHSEMQALTYLKLVSDGKVKNPDPRVLALIESNDIHLHIDRPPCDHTGMACNSALEWFLKQSKLNITIHYVETDPETNELVRMKIVKDKNGDVSHVSDC